MVNRGVSQNTYEEACDTKLDEGPLGKYQIHYPKCQSHIPNMKTPSQISKHHPKYEMHDTKYPT